MDSARPETKSNLAFLTNQTECFPEEEHQALGIFALASFDLNNLYLCLCQCMFDNCLALVLKLELGTELKSVKELRLASGKKYCL